MFSQCTKYPSGEINSRTYVHMTKKEPWVHLWGTIIRLTSFLSRSFMTFASNLESAHMQNMKKHYWMISCKCWANIETVTCLLIHQACGWLHRTPFTLIIFPRISRLCVPVGLQCLCEWAAVGLLFCLCGFICVCVLTYADSNKLSLEVGCALVVRLIGPRSHWLSL